jgi:predicted KAP-like P-loop ATPase
VLNSDAPINAPSQDLLGRNGFARSLAKTINHWDGKESLVIALYGEYGSGKTSVKNVVKQLLETEFNYSKGIVEFNPWQWAGTENIQKAFFSEVGIGIGKAVTKSDKEISYWWNLFAARINTVSFVNQTLLQLGLFSIAALSTVGILSGFVQNEYVKIGSIIVYAVSGLLSISFLFLKKLSKILSEFYEARSAYSEKSLSEIKKELSKHLLKLEKSVFVIIDDVDRLTPDQILEVSKLLKANGDLPKLVYLVLADKKILANGINSALNVDGSEYLSKIIQVGFNIPEIDRGRLNNILYESLGKILQEYGVNYDNEGQRWVHLYHLGLFPLFDNLRTMKRFLTGLKFNMGLFKSSNGKMEVNAIDFIALEALRYFETDLYDAMPSYSYFLTQNPRALENIGTESDERNQLPAKVLALISDKNKKWGKEILMDIFPSLFGPGTSISDDEKVTSFRICHHDNFDRYFNLTIPHGQIRIDELESTIALQTDLPGFESTMNQWNDREIILDGLSRLYLQIEEIKPENINNVLGAFFNFSDTVPRARGLLAVGPVDEMRSICGKLLLSISDQTERENCFLEGLHLSKGLYLPAKLISWDYFEYVEKDKKKEDRSPLFSQDGYNRIVKAWIEKAREASTDTSLLKSHNLDFVIYWWLKWDEGSEAANIFKNQMSTRDGFFKVLRLVAFKPSDSIGSGFNRKNYSIDPNLAIQILSEESLRARITEYEKAQKNLEEEEILAILKGSLDAKRQGYYP